MTPVQALLTSGIILVGAMVAGCATSAAQPFVTSCGSDYTCAKEMAFKYRQQAAELSALAQHYEIEAQTKSQELGKEAEEVKRHRDLANQFWAEAQVADDLARQYRSQVPHNVIN